MSDEAEKKPTDVAIVDPLWNGVWQSVRIASFADAYETAVAPHNPVGELGSMAVMADVLPVPGAPHSNTGTPAATAIPSASTVVC